MSKWRPLRGVFSDAGTNSNSGQTTAVSAQGVARRFGWWCPAHLAKVLVGPAALLIGLQSVPVARAEPIDIAQFAGFLNSPTLGAQSLEDTRIGSGFNELAAAGLGVAFTSGLDAESFGTLSWLISNGTGSTLEDVSFFAFLDAEVLEPGNSFFNESGALVDVSGTGPGDTAADTWEIDEPGFLFGDIFTNLLAGSLDQTNAVPQGLEDDVSLALGFRLGDVLSGERILASFEISRDDIGGLSHTDADLGLTFFFNGSVQVLAVSVPEPGTTALIGPALLWFAASTRLRRRSPRRR